ncbi:MAG: mitochondrial fission ELM1 family protein [Alphaproteobacteria bacterium]
MESQCRGLAKALGFEPTIKRVRLNTPWRQLTPYLRFGLEHAFADSADPIAPPWPDVLIASGRHSIAASLYVRQVSRNSGKGTLTIQIQNPGIDPKSFDFVVAPAHDGLEGENVITTLGALHSITPELINEAAIAFTPCVSNLRPPYLGVLIGGPNRAYRFSAADMSKMATEVGQFAKRFGLSVLVTPSRRTGNENLAILKKCLADVPAFIWDMEGPNPYFGILGLSDFLVVTPDSVNMVTEACATGKPVFVYDLPGGSPKFDRFHQAIRQQGYARKFDPKAALDKTAKRLDEMSSVAQRIINSLGGPGLDLRAAGPICERTELARS